MRAELVSADYRPECLSDERCFILELSNDPDDPAVSITRARVSPGITTKLHRLRNIEERYVILSGWGMVEIDEKEPRPVRDGNVVRIPSNVPQRISNYGADDLVFLCICTPRFEWQYYELLE